MDEWEMECLDCGWRGMISELIEEPDESDDGAPGSCPDCGGSKFEKRVDRDEK